VRSTEHYGKTDWSASTAWVLHFTDEDRLDELIAFLGARLQHLPALIAVAAGASQTEMRYAAG
jgi:hypothetical protein